MTPLSRFGRIALLITLMPQLLMLGLGGGVVICVAPGGHLHVEVAATDCCIEASPDVALAHDRSSASEEAPECDSCSDYRIVPDSRLARRSSPSKFELPAQTAAIVPVQSQIFPEATRPVRVSRIHLDRHQPPPHLIHMRSVVLRC